VLSYWRVPVASPWASVPAEPGHRVRPVADDAVQRDLQAYNSFILLAGRSILLTGEPDNVGGHRPAGALVALVVGHFRARSRDQLLLWFLRGISGSRTRIAASQSKIFIDAQVKEGYGLSFFYRDHRGLGGVGVIIALDPDDRVRGGLTSIGPCTRGYSAAC